MKGLLKKAWDYMGENHPPAWAWYIPAAINALALIIAVVALMLYMK